MGIEVIDHLITAGKDVYSFQEQGRIDEPPSAVAIKQKISKKLNEYFM